MLIRAVPTGLRDQVSAWVSERVHQPNCPEDEQRFALALTSDRKAGTYVSSLWWNKHVGRWSTVVILSEAGALRGRRGVKLTARLLVLPTRACYVGGERSGVIGGSWHGRNWSVEPTRHGFLLVSQHMHCQFCTCWIWNVHTGVGYASTTQSHESRDIWAHHCICSLTWGAAGGEFWYWQPVGEIWVFPFYQYLIFLQVSSFGTGRVWTANCSFKAFFDQEFHILLQALREKKTDR